MSGWNRSVVHHSKNMVRLFVRQEGLNECWNKTRCTTSYKTISGGYVYGTKDRITVEVQLIL